MFKHEKQLFHPVEVERPNPQYAVLLQEQLGGGNGELKAAMQYMTKLLCGDIKKEILDFGILDPEALRHILHCRLELTVTAAELFLKQYGVLRVRSFDLYGME